MVVMQVDPDAQGDDVLQALARNTRHRLDDLIGYADVIPPKLSQARLRTLQHASDLLASIDREHAKGVGSLPSRDA